MFDAEVADSARVEALGAIDHGHRKPGGGEGCRRLPTARVDNHDLDGLGLAEQGLDGAYQPRLAAQAHDDARELRHVYALLPRWTPVDRARGLRHT
jgi:hypothetical protein